MLSRRSEVGGRRSRVAYTKSRAEVREYSRATPAGGEGWGDIFVRRFPEASDGNHTGVLQSHQVENVFNLSRDFYHRVGSSVWKTHTFGQM